MSVLVVVLALVLLMAVAYRGMSVIVFAPICALLAVAFSLGPDSVLPAFSQIFMKRMVVFVELYFPVFLLGAVFGKVMELSGAAASVASNVARLTGPKHVIFAVVMACAVLTYGGVSLFVVAFAIYPIAAVLFRAADIPKRLIPGAIALGSFSFTMDALPGTPQIQNLIPTSFFGTDIYAAPLLGTTGSVYMLAAGMTYLQWRRRQAREGYGTGHSNEPAEAGLDAKTPTNPWIALAPLGLVALANFIATRWISRHYGAVIDLAARGWATEGTLDLTKVAGIWAIEIALCAGIAAALLIGSRRLRGQLAHGIQSAVMGSLLATMNTASEFGFGAVIASLAGFGAIKSALDGWFTNPLINEAVCVNVLAGITGSASGGLSLALAALGGRFKTAATLAGVDPQVLHRVAAMSSGGMDTLPHNGAVITLLVITGLTHRQSYRDILALTAINISAVSLVIVLYQATRLA